MGTMRRLVGAVAVVVLVAAACGSDGDDEEGTTTSSTAAGPATSSPSAEGSTEAPADLPASARGVTSDSIKVGVAVPDFDALQEAGVSNYQGDAEVTFQAFIDRINADGGIAGRSIDPVYVSFDFVKPETQDAACIELVEDHEVFIVLYGLLGDNNLCLTGNETMVMTRSFQTTDLRDRAEGTLWLQLDAADDERVRIMGQALAEAGRLDGHTIGIVASAAQDGGVEGEVLQETLRELGFDATLLIGGAGAGDDPIARESEQRIFAERLQADGVTFVFELLGGDNLMGVFASEGYEPESAHKALGASVDGAEDRTVMDGALGVGARTEQEMIDDPTFQSECMDVVRDANPELEEEMAFIPTGDEQAAGQPNWINPVMIACDQTMLLQQLGEIVGAELTNETFLAALDDLGQVELRGYGAATFRSADKWDGTDEFSIQEYDAAADEIVVVEPVVVDR